VGLAPYRLDRRSDHREWRKEKYLLRQIELIRQLEGLQGFGYFSSNHFFRDDLARLNRKLHRKICPLPALVPVMPWIDSQAPGRPLELRREGNNLSWKAAPASGEMDRSRFFALYRYDQGDNMRAKNGRNLVEVTGELRISFEDGIPPGIYRVAALDRLNNESQLSEALEVP
jgi:hypothetical protein